MIIVPDGTANRIPSAALEAIVKGRFLSADKYGLTLLDGAAVSALAKTDSLRKRLSAIKKKLKAGRSEPELAALGRDLGIKYYLIVNVTESSDTEEPAEILLDTDHYDGDFSWPSFSVPIMQTKGNASIECQLFSVPLSSYVQRLSSSAELSSNYDTRDTFRQKKIEIFAENQRRRSENARRENIMREEIAKTREESKSVVLQLLTLAESPAMYNLNLLSAAIEMEPQHYADKSLLYRDLYASGFEKIAVEFFNRYDGVTLSGDSVNGSGSFRFSNGDTCTGEWVNGESNGYAEYFYKKGGEYRGFFRGGAAFGKGAFRMADGNTYVGDFEDGLMHGKGLIRFEKSPSTDIVFAMGGRVISDPGELYSLRDSAPNKVRSGHTYSLVVDKGVFRRVLEVRTSKKETSK